MIRFQATSRCECQARLEATLNEARLVLEGTAIRRGAPEKAPAHSIGAERDHFDVAWMCPFCGRNTLRTFYAAALPRIVVPDPARAAEASKA